MYPMTADPRGAHVCASEGQACDTRLGIADRSMEEGFNCDAG